MKNDDNERNLPLGNQTSEEIKRTTSSGRTGGQFSVQKNSHIKIGRHGADMIMTSDPEKQESMLSQVGLPEGVVPATMEERLKLVKSLIAQSMGYQDEDINEVPDRIGFNLTNQAERDVLFGVLRMMTESDYKGTYKVPSSEVVKMEHRDKDNLSSVSEKSKDIVKKETEGYTLDATETHIGGAWKNIDSTPVLRMTQGQLIQALGYDSTSQSDRQRVSQAVVNLATKQNFLMWTRFARDKNGKVEKRNGRTKYEVVSTFSPVLNVNFVSEPDEKGKLVLKYYEISLAPVFLDEISREYGSVRDGYFLLIPSDCNQEIERAFKRLFPYRVRVSPTIQALCYWLRLQVSDSQRKERNPFSKIKMNPILRIPFSDLCSQLNISEMSFRTQKSRVRQVVEDGLVVAKEIGYITDSHIDEQTGEVQFDLNIDFYPNRFKQEEQVPPTPQEGENTTEREEQTTTLFG